MHETWRLLINFFNYFNCFSLDAIQKTVFFILKPIYGGADGDCLKYMSVTPLNNNVLEKQVL